MTERLCASCAALTGMSGAGIMLMADDLAQGSLCSTGPTSALIEQVQYTLGEGPCVDAHRQGRPVVEPDLAGTGAGRWAAFVEPVVAAGVGAVFGFPLRVGAVRLGALNLYRDSPGDLSDDQHADALVLADVAAEVILLLQARAPAGMLADELARSADLHVVVHQAAGMVAVQLGIGVTDALVRLRAHAFAYDRPLREVADDVVARRLRFDTLDDQDD
ncbi:MAG TPA: GAF and ANTAR domain-containing protein [Kribbellaceae bacterium]|nr:GAF and ANTAR domain-containing protein [Kribbellaceae bacterium]